MTSEIYCPECSNKMHKMGKIWSGRKQVQRYRCPKCGRTTIRTSEDDRSKED